MMKQTACHELLHLVQSLYDTCTIRALQWGHEELWIWFYEASATWFEQFATENRASYVNPDNAAGERHLGLA